METLNSNLDLAAERISKSRRCIVFSGAGMSADSGIDTFRSSGSGGSSLWGGLIGKVFLAYGGTPIGWNWTPGYVWYYFITSFLEPIVKAKPHRGYDALREIKEMRYDDDRFHVITMNVDGFHQASGIPSENVAEVHGTIRKYRCIKCSAPIEIDDPVSTKNDPPRCTSSGCNGYPRPDVTLFTETLPGEEWRKAMEALDQMKRGDVMVVVGTSSVVYPAASIPEQAKQRGVFIIEVNPDERTPLSGIVDIKLQGGAADVLTALSARLRDVLESSASR